MQTTMEQARKAKPKAVAAASACSPVVGAGLCKIGGSYAVKVNLREPSASVAGLPARIDGVQVIYEVVGPVLLRSAASS
ncbi:hypothetical protein [Xenophilus azovorans]|jgi:hypothetical protein|uniref:hypothetical protein n=1 Tax=Xenophilus TaxID=151754 RepID=UPI00056E2711|nr:hypothetical protein [Xenophilus azovorans]